MGVFPENESTIQQDGQNRPLTFPAAVLGTIYIALKNHADGMKP